MKVAKTYRFTTALWMLFVAGLVAEHGYIGYKAHFVLMENQVLKTQLSEARESERSLGIFVKTIIPGTAVQEEEENKDQKKNTKAANNPPPHPGIKLNGKAQ